MNIDEIKRPSTIQVNEGGIQAEISSHLDYYDPATEELADVLIAPTLVQTGKKDGDDKFPLPIDERMFNEDVFRKFNGITYGIGKLVRLAELNLDSLIGIIKVYLGKYPFDSIVNRHRECKGIAQYDVEKDFHKLTFNMLRNILSCIVKTDETLHIIDELNSIAKRKNFTKIYSNYIEDRDRFTHGILFFLYPDFEPILRIKTVAGDTEYVNYDEEIFICNLKTFNYLTTVLDKIRKILQP